MRAVIQSLIFSLVMILSISLIQAHSCQNPQIPIVVNNQEHTATFVHLDPKVRTFRILAIPNSDIPAIIGVHRIYYRDSDTSQVLIRLSSYLPPNDEIDMIGCVEVRLGSFAEYYWNIIILDWKLNLGLVTSMWSIGSNVSWENGYLDQGITTSLGTGVVILESSHYGFAGLGYATPNNLLVITGQPILDSPGTFLEGKGRLARQEEIDVGYPICTANIKIEEYSPRDSDTHPFRDIIYVRDCYPQENDKIQILTIEPIVEESFIQQMLNDTFLVVQTIRPGIPIGFSIFMEIEFEPQLYYLWPEFTYRIIPETYL